MNIIDEMRLRNQFGNMFSGQNPNATSPLQSTFTNNIGNTPGLFNPPKPIGQMASESNSAPLNTPDYGLASLRNKLKRPASDEFKQFISNEPNRRDYQQGKIGKALAMIAGVSTGAMQGAPTGIAIGRDILDRPFEQARGDWASKGNRLKMLADIEDKERTDDIALETAISKEGFDRQANEREWMKAISTMNLNEANITRIKDDIKNGRIQLKVNDKGQIIKIDPINKTVEPFGKVDEGKQETREAEQNMWSRRYGIEQAGRIALKNMDIAADTNLENLRFGNDKAKAKYANDLKQAGFDPKKAEEALNAATLEALAYNPGLRSRLFLQNPNNGKWTAKTDAERTDDEKKTFDADQKNFAAKVQQRTNRIMGKPIENPVFTEDEESNQNNKIPNGVDPRIINEIKKDPDYQPGDESDPSVIQAMGSWMQENNMLGSAPANNQPLGGNIPRVVLSSTNAQDPIIPQQPRLNIIQNSSLMPAPPSNQDPNSGLFNRYPNTRGIVTNNWMNNVDRDWSQFGADRVAGLIPNLQSGRKINYGR